MTALLSLSCTIGECNSQHENALRSIALVHDTATVTGKRHPQAPDAQWLQLAPCAWAVKRGKDVGRIPASIREDHLAAWVLGPEVCDIIHLGMHSLHQDTLRSVHTEVHHLQHADCLLG